MLGIIDVGGGMRGIYGAGVLDRFLEEGIEADYFIGVSAGSANGCSYLAAQKGRNYRFYNEYAYRKEYMSFRNLFQKGSYLDLDYIYGTLSNENGEYPLDYDALLRHHADLEFVTTEAESGKAEYFSKYEMVRNQYSFLKMSSCVPVIDKPYPYQNKLYFDGGLSDPIPWQRAVDKGCDQIVLILTRSKNQLRTDTKDKVLSMFLSGKYREAKKRLQERSSLYNMQLKQVLRLEKENRIMIASPDDISHLKTLTLDHDALDTLYKKGYTDAETIITKL